MHLGTHINIHHNITIIVLPFQENTYGLGVEIEWSFTRIHGSL